MRLAVMADTHGNLPALEAVLADVQRHEVDGIIVAGDLTGGPHPIETICLLRSLGCWMIRGNGDSRLVEYDHGNLPGAWRTCQSFAMLRWDYDHVDRETLEFIESLPEQRVVQVDGAAPVRVVHGSLRDPSEGLCPVREPDTLDLALAQTSEPVLVCGHTHIAWKVRRDGKLALNPGAVCGSLNGDVRAQYALLRWCGDYWQVEHRAIPYDLARICADFEVSGLLEKGGPLARAFLLSIETGQNVAEDFLAYANDLAARAGLENCDAIPDEIWERAGATFDWRRYRA